jgi:hypothetical protein
LEKEFRFEEEGSDLAVFLSGLDWTGHFKKSKL